MPCHRRAGVMLSASYIALQMTLHCALPIHQQPRLPGVRTTVAPS